IPGWCPWRTSRSSPRPMGWTARSWVRWVSSAPAAWPTTGSFPSSISRPACCPMPSARRPPDAAFFPFQTMSRFLPEMSDARALDPDAPAAGRGPLGVLLINLGTPDAPTPAAVRRYLGEFLSDPRVVELPAALWQIVLRL